MIINWIKSYGIFVLIIYLQIFIAYDIPRILINGFFPVILLNLSGMQRLNEKRNIIGHTNAAAHAEKGQYPPDSQNKSDGP